MIPTKRMDLTGRKPLYRLSATPAPPTTPQTSNVKPAAQTPTHPPAPQYQPWQQTPPHPYPAPSPHGQPSQVLSPYNEANYGADMQAARRRGRMLFENELIILFKGCIERKDMYLTNPNRSAFWDNVAGYMNSFTGRNFSPPSYQQIVTDRSIERRTHRRDIANGKAHVEPPNALTTVIDQWIAMEDDILKQTSESEFLSRNGPHRTTPVRRMPTRLNDCVRIRQMLPRPPPRVLLRCVARWTGTALPEPWCTKYEIYGGRWKKSIGNWTWFWRRSKR